MGNAGSKFSSIFSVAEHNQILSFGISSGPILFALVCPNTVSIGYAEGFEIKNILN